MRIDSVPPNELLSRYNKIKGQAPVNRDINIKDEAELTNEAKTVSVALKTVKATMEVRTPEELAHIEKVAQQVREGTYSVPSRKVAEKILGLYK